jgi:predicted enzyme related to lactoylglutathione lyase
MLKTAAANSSVGEQMITGVQDVYYNVSDMRRAVRFYSDALGMKVEDENDWWTSLELAGCRIGLHWTEGQPVPKIPRDSHGAHAGATLTLKSTDILADRRGLEAAGTTILGEIDAPWGHLLIFEDPDGNVLKLMQPKP